MALCKLFEIYTGRAVPVSEEDLENRNEDEQVEYVFSEMERTNLLPVVVDLGYFQRYVRIYQSNMEAITRYTPCQYDGKLVVFRSTETLPGMPGIANLRTDDPSMEYCFSSLTK